MKRLFVSMIAAFFAVFLQGQEVELALNLENPQLPDGMVIPMTILNDTKITGQ